MLPMHWLATTTFELELLGLFESAFSDLCIGNVGSEQKKQLFSPHSCCIVAGRGQRGVVLGVHRCCAWFSLPPVDNFGSVV